MLGGGAGQPARHEVGEPARACYDPLTLTPLVRFEPLTGAREHHLLAGCGVPFRMRIARARPDGYLHLTVQHTQEPTRVGAPIKPVSFGGQAFLYAGLHEET